MNKKEKATTSAKDTAPTNNVSLPAAYQTLSPEGREKAIARIAERRSDIPAIYRGSYDKAISGKSLREAVNSFCRECVMWQRVEVRLCPSTPCPLWPYRPYQLNDTDGAATCSNLSSDRPDSDSKSTNAENGKIGL
jgi:hypothetical protein